MKNLGLAILMVSMHFGTLVAQGPPITLDKPIMLGKHKATVRTMFRLAKNQVWDYAGLVAEGDYNFTNNFAAGLEIPLVYNISASEPGIGDLSAMVKYQLIRKDGVGKTIRIAAKGKHTFPTGGNFGTPTLGMGQNMSYLGILAAREALHLGIQVEAGYMHAWQDQHMNQWVYKFGLGLPLLKPKYPVKQVNLYFEWEGMNLAQHAGEAQYGYYYAQGLQYARHKNTLEASFQFPIAQQLSSVPGMNRQWMMLLGARRVL